MKKLWEKDTKSSNAVDTYCFDEGVILDNELVDEDIFGSIAHAYVLDKLGIISKNDLKKIIETLKEILELKSKGDFIVQQGDEDVHTKVENYLIKKLELLGKKIHTGRSRNDQVLVDIRLYSKKKIFETISSVNRLIEIMAKYAKKYEFIPMPGYTHMQKAMPSSVGMWMGSFGESLIDDSFCLKNAYLLNDQSPLGTGAAYGISLPIDRNLTANLLGFSKVQNNSLYSQVSRPKIQLVVMQALVQIMLTLSRFAQDVLLFTTFEYNFFAVSPELCTGSSIMPQKKNIDIMEYLRAKTHEVIGFNQIIAGTAAGLISGYNADFSETKGIYMKSFNIVIQSLDIVIALVASLKPNTDVLDKAMTKDLFATHAAYELVKKGVPFRDAYVKIGKSLNTLPTYDVQEVLKSSEHIGGTGNLGLDNLMKQKDLSEKWWIKQQKLHRLAINNLLK